MDIQYATKEICRGMAVPKASSMSKMKRLARYLLGCPRQVLVFRPCSEEAPEMVVYSDSDWAGCLRTRKSTSGGVLAFQGGSLRRGAAHRPALHSPAAKQNIMP